MRPDDRSALDPARNEGNDRSPDGAAPARNEGTGRAPTRKRWRSPLVAIALAAPILALVLWIWARERSAPGEGGPGATVAPGAAEGTRIGVEPCDDYLTKIVACMATSPTVKGTSETGFQQTRDRWKQAAEQGGAAREKLRESCAAALEAIPSVCR